MGWAENGRSEEWDEVARHGELTASDGTVRTREISTGGSNTAECSLPYARTRAYVADPPPRRAGRRGRRRAWRRH
jgi:hypothetical protein